MFSKLPFQEFATHNAFIITQVSENKKRKGKKKTNLGYLLRMIKYIFKYPLDIAEENYSCT